MKTCPPRQRPALGAAHIAARAAMLRVRAWIAAQRGGAALRRAGQGQWLAGGPCAPRSTDVARVRFDPLPGRVLDRALPGASRDFAGWRRVTGGELAALLLLAAVPPSAGAARPGVDLQCEVVGRGPQLECTVHLSGADGQPLSRALAMLDATMPSMPMAHHVEPAMAVATGAPGEYRGRLALEMSGAWAVQLDIAAPVRERFARTLQIDECEGDRHCPVVPVAAPVSPAAAKPALKP